MTRRILISLSVLIVFVLQLGGSCSSSNNHDDDYHGHDGGGGGGYYPGGGGGGGYDRPGGIPHSAIRVAEDGGKVYWTAHAPGFVYVYSVDDRVIPWSGPIRRGDQLVVVPNSDDIVINNKVVWHGNLKRESRHQVFFDHEGGGSGGSGGWSGGGGGGSGGYDRPGGVPHDAIRVAEDGGKVYWTSDGNGTVWVYSVDDHVIPWSGPIRHGDQMVVVPDSDDIVINKKVVWHGNLKRDSRHQIFFSREGGGSGGGGGGNGIPGGWTVLAHGRGDLVIERAPRDGTVYIFDNDDRRVVYQCPIGHGNSFQMFPSKSYVNLNSKRYADVRMSSNHNYTLYFQDR